MAIRGRSFQPAVSLTAIGGRLTDITPDALRTPPSELIFVYSDVGGSVPFPRLEVMMVPEPASAACLGLVLIWAAVRRFRQ